MKHRAKPKYADNFSYLLQLLSCVLNDTTPPKPTQHTDWASVFSMAELHSVAGMVYYALKRLDEDQRPSDDIFELFEHSYRQQLIVDANVSFETDMLLSEFSRLGIPLLPLKGIVLKHDYPDSVMRTMTDVDILYKASDREKILKVFSSFGYTLTHEIDRELDFVKEPFHHYELHSSLLPSTKDVSYEYFSDIWQKVEFDDNSSIGKLNPSDRYIYLLEHLAKHMENGGAGLRMIMDVYVFNKAHAHELDQNYLDNELTKLRLLDFSRIIKDLAFNWFGGGVPATDTQVADFILCCCTFGTSRNAILQEAIRSENKSGKKQSGIARIFRRICPTYNYICTRFESAKKLKFLYPLYIPVYWCLRAFKYRNINTGNIGYYFESTDSDTAERLRSVMSDLGLSSRL